MSPRSGASSDGGVAASKGARNPATRDRTRAELLVSIRIARRERANRFHRPALVDGEHQRPSVARKRDQPRIGTDELDAAMFEPHVAHDRRPQRSDRVRQRRTFEPWRDFLGHRRAADDRSTLEHERLQSGFCQIERGREAVVAGADDDDAAHRPAPVSFRMRCAALRPGAPMIPPPGWVADPHM